MGNLQSSPSSSTTTLQEKYDVFLSFRGEDTRDGFTNNLYEALSGKKIKTFMDDQLTRGDIISQALTEAIEESKISVIIFSKDYASSKWCLHELVDIMERKKMNKQTVIPVFYGVDPSDVRNQTGSFKDSFVKHEFFFPDEVQKWREALNEASHLSGWSSSVTRPDTKLVNTIVDDIYEKLMGENILSTSDFKGLIGLDEQIKKVKSLLCLHKIDVRIIGIWGMGGIGKTTLARAIFEQISGHQFEGVCLIENVRERLENRGGLDCMQKIILSEVLKDKKLELDGSSTIPPIIKKRLDQTKVFIVLDDVDDFRPLETLARRVDGLGQGSRIIITSRDKRELRNCRVNDQNIYEVKELNHDEALRLFCSYAFNQNYPTEDLRILSNMIVDYAKGNPLALIVLGSSLNQESKKVWESAVNKLRTNVDHRIFDVLKISYDGLKHGEQEVFLDIACFLKWKNQDYVASILDDCECSLSALINKSLITVSSHNTIEMHDLLQDMGREIVRKQSPTDPGKRSRLWAPEDVQCTLKNNAGTSEVQGIFLDMFKIKDMHLSPKAFKKMFNLRLLKFYCSDYYIRIIFERPDAWSSSNVQFREGLNNASFDKLRSFIWYGYPLTVPSSNFNPENLVELDLSMGNLERLWDDNKHAPKLRWLILGRCLHLTKIPDLSKSPLLERIDLHGCLRLTKIPNLSKLPLLKEINLNGCSRLTEIPDLSESILLERIDLHGCFSLTKIPNLSKLPFLKEINLNGCSRFTEIPDLSESPLLERIDLHGCLRLTKIPNLSKLPLLKEINLNGCSRFTEIPDLSESLLLERIDLHGCFSLLKIPNLSKLPLLKEIDLGDCRSLLDFPLLAKSPKNLLCLNLRGCKSLRSFPSNIHFESLDTLDLGDCIDLTTFPQIFGNLSRLDLSGTAIDEVPPSIENLINLYYLDLPKSIRLISTNICRLKFLNQLDLENCSQLESFPEILDKMKRLKILNLSGTAIKELPHSIENLTKLSKLYLRRCNNLESLPCSLCNLISLKCLDISDCPKLEILPDNLGNLKSLEDLSMDRIAISQLPSTMMRLNKTVKISCCGCRDMRFTDLLGLPCSLTSLDFNDCNLKIIPEDIGRLSSLECLELSGNNFESLPKSMKQLYKLTSLRVDNCNMLRSLTDLPSAMEYLSASGCNMLQSLTELPSALKQISVSGCNMLQSLSELPSALRHLSASGCKQLRSIPDASEFANLVEAEFIFTNCLNLKETAVGNMLATLKEGYEEGDEIGELTFFCPGSKVPEWFMYRTEGSSIVECCELKFQMPWHDGSNGRPLLGFVVCAAIAFEKYCCIKGDLKHLCVVYKYTCSDGDESSPNNITVASRNGGVYISVGFRKETLIDSDHIAFRFFKISVPRISESGFSNCTFELWLPVRVHEDISSRDIEN